MNPMKPRLKTALALAAGALVCLPAAAHPQSGGAHWHGMFAGFAHPFTGLDHLLAMLAVGLWSARQTNGKAVPLAFMAMLLAGVASGVAGLTIPGLETGIALTVALLGMLIAAALRLPAALALVMVGSFALLHGNAHGLELPQAGSAVGLLLASALLVGLGRVAGRCSPALALRLAGVAIAVTGVALAAGT